MIFPLKNTSLFLIIALGIISCATPADTNAPKSYFDLKAFIETQIKELNKRKPLVEKELTIGNDKENLQTTDIDWADELSLFLQADLNKQANQLSYTITQPQPNTYVYAIKSGEKLPVKYLKVIADEAKRVLHVEAKLVESNKLYDSEKQIAFDCTMRPEGVWLIKNYQIEGFQHLTLTDKKFYKVIGIIK